MVAEEGCHLSCKGLFRSRVEGGPCLDNGKKMNISFAAS